MPKRCCASVQEIDVANNARGRRGRDHAHETADRAAAIRVVRSDVLEHGGLAEAHEKAEHIRRFDQSS